MNCPDCGSDYVEIRKYGGWCYKCSAYSVPPPEQKREMKNETTMSESKRISAAELLDMADQNPSDTDESNNTDNEQRDREAFVEEKLIDAEIKIEGALQACEDPDERGELIALYRDVIGILFRYHDSVE